MKKLLALLSLCFSLLMADDLTSTFIINQPQQYYPSTTVELQSMVQQASVEHKKVCLVGANKSQGGQTIANESCCRINLNNMHNVLDLNINNKEITVQAGMTWRELQEKIAPFGLSVKAKQSYSDFSIGGSLSVNVHGQDIIENPLIKSVLSFRLLNAQGQVINVSRTENAELFTLVIGGYGLFGIITEVTLSLTTDELLVRKAVILKADELPNYFLTTIKTNPAVKFYSARYSLMSYSFLDKVVVITYETAADQTDKKLLTFKPATTKTKVENNLTKGLLTLTKNPLIRTIRFPLEKLSLKKEKTVSRNNFMYELLAGLPQDDANNMYILQEYFIPYDKVNQFITNLKKATQNYSINLLNITARHVNADNESMLSYAPTERCAFVLYINVKKNNAAYTAIAQYTNQLIEDALKAEGSFYLPYQLLATQQQVHVAYPHFKEFIALKKEYDVQELFVNNLYLKYV